MKRPPLEVADVIRVAQDGASSIRSRWIASQTSFFLPIAVLKKVFRDKFTGSQQSLSAAQTEVSTAV